MSEKRREHREESLPEELEFKDSKIQKNLERKGEAIEHGNFVFEESLDESSENEKKKNKIHFLGLKKNDMTGEDKELMITFETDIQTEEEMREILDEARMTPLFRKIIYHIADSQKSDFIPFLQSAPGTGKTFGYDIYNKLIHGEDARAEYLICTKNTSELDIIGHWAPKGDSGEGTKDKVGKILEDNERYQEFKAAFNEKLSNLAQQKKQGKIQDEEFDSQVARFTDDLIELQREIVSKTGNTSQWTFHKGALLKAYTDPTNDPEDKGRMLVVDEFDKLPPNLQNIFLQVSGTRARLAKKIVTYADGGTTDYMKGEDTAVVFAGNFLADGNVLITEPMMDRLTPLRISKYESDVEVKEQITRYSFGKLQEMFPESNKETVENLRFFLSNALAQLHQGWKEFYDINKTKWLKTGANKYKSDAQPKEYSQRTIHQFEDALLANLQDEINGESSNFVDADSGKVNLRELFTSIFQTHYLNFCGNEDLVPEFINAQMFPVLSAGSEKLIKSDKGKGYKLQTLKETTDVNHLYGYEKDKGTFSSALALGRGGIGRDKDLVNLGEAMNTLVDMLVNADQLKEKEERERRQAIEEKINTVDVISAQLLANPDIPESTKESIRKLAEHRQKLKEKI